MADVVPDDSFLQGLSPSAFADRLFADVDANGDGDITFDEFKLAAEQNETLIDLLLPAPTWMLTNSFQFVFTFKKVKMIVQNESPYWLKTYIGKTFECIDLKGDGKGLHPLSKTHGKV